MNVYDLQTQSAKRISIELFKSLDVSEKIDQYEFLEKCREIYNGVNGNINFMRIITKEIIKTYLSKFDAICKTRDSIDEHINTLFNATHIEVMHNLDGLTIYPNKNRFLTHTIFIHREKDRVKHRDNFDLNIHIFFQCFQI
uniref:Uncharacterized protein n=1 Tax=viral metagenome TaxID=1070528 RepID=A0A6C0J8H6_9ZZZZ